MKRFIVLLNRLFGRSDVCFANSLYMQRWKLGPQKLPGLRLHKIVRSDSDRELHDHPFTFLTFILRGGYFEHLADGSRTWHGPGSVLLRSAEVLHRLELTWTRKPATPEGEKVELPAWTFVLRGPYRREWGFVEQAIVRSWTPWQRFVAKRRDEEGVTKRVDSREFSAETSI